MAILMPHIPQVKLILQRSCFARNIANAVTVPKSCLAIYVRDSQRKRFVVPISYLNEPAFQDLRSRAMEAFWCDHSEGGLTIPRKEDIFTDLTSRLRKKSERT